MAQHAAASPLLDALVALRAELAGTTFGLEPTGAAEAGRAEILGQLDDYLLPRLHRIDAPMLVVVGGSTGAGKSTLVNTLVGVEVSAAGVLRPTTRSPVLVCNPADRPWFDGERILPGLRRVTGADDPTGSGTGDTAGTDVLRIVESPVVPVGMALLDAPDIDSVVESNRRLAAQLLAAGDLWLFVTTAARYADAVPWDLLRTARERSTALAVVLDRVPPEGLGEVEAHLSAMLADQGLRDAPVLVVAESTPSGGLLPWEAIAPVRDWLSRLALDADARATVVRRTLVGALDSLTPRLRALADAAAAEELAAAELRQAVDSAYARALEHVDQGVRDGSLLRGEVLARWQEFVGTGELLRTLESRIGRLRDRIVASVRGRPAPAREVQVALEHSVEALVRDAAERAAEATAATWAARPDGARLLGAAGEELSRASRDVGPSADRQVREWQGHVLELVRGQGADRRAVARVASYGVNAAGVALMVTVFAHTGGLTGGEIAVAGGTAALSQKVLEALFGDQAVRRLADDARRDLLRRVGDVLETEAQRFRRLVDGAVPTAGRADRLRASLHAVETARAAAA